MGDIKIIFKQWILGVVIAIGMYVDLIYFPNTYKGKIILVICWVVYYLLFDFWFVYKKETKMPNKENYINTDTPIDEEKEKWEGEEQDRDDYTHPDDK